MPQPNLNRERFILASVLSAAVMAVNAPFCSAEGEREPINSDPEYLDKLADLVAAETSHMAVEDTISVLERVLQKRQSKLSDLTNDADHQQSRTRPL